jgi:hypothetical protein
MRVPRRYAVVAVALSIADVAVNGLLELRHGWSVRGEQMGVAAALCVLVYYFLFRRLFLASRGNALPHRGFQGWLVTLPGWLMSVTLLACFCLAPLAITTAAWSLLRLPDESTWLLAIGTTGLFFGWAVAAALLEQRRQAQVTSAR